MIRALARFFGSANERRIKDYRPRVDAINALEGELAALTDDALRARTEEFRQQLAAGKTLDDILVPAFATCREAAKRALGQRHFDVQMIGGMILHEGAIAEMKTGEGKTLVATLPVYLNALAGKGVHVVTVNDYLAKRDAEWMGQIYGFLGLTVGTIVHGLDDEERKRRTPATSPTRTNNELGFDYLRDNMKYRLEDMVQRGHVFAIVDEVDSILIDEARTPLIISGPLDDRSDFYNTIDAYHPQAREGRLRDRREAAHREPHRGRHGAGWSSGCATPRCSSPTRSTTSRTSRWCTTSTRRLRAHKLFARDKDYIVRNGEVVIIDEFTGRMMPGRRYSEGLHQALEAKEHQPIQPENQTLASITFQNYFRMYDKLAGMTGTALTEADEFLDIYNLEVLEVPTNMPLARLDEDDEVYRTNTEKYALDHHAAGGVQDQGPAGAGRHHLDREVRAAGRDAASGGLGAARLLRPERVRGALHRRRGRQEDQGVRGAQRALPRAGGLHRGAGGRAGRDHDRHQHGGPRHRHPARRQCRHAHPPGACRRRGLPDAHEATRARTRSGRRWRG